MDALKSRLIRIFCLCWMFGPGAVFAAPDAELDQQAAYNISQSVVGKQIGNYILRDRNGNNVRLSDYLGKPLLVSFVYTGCFETCPTDTVVIAKAVSATQDLLGSDVFHTISIGFNVPFDSPEAMATFARQRGISPRNWEFLSPDISNIAALARDFGFSYVATPKGFDHITQLTVVNRNGRIYRQLYSDSLNPQSIINILRDINNGVVPVAQGWSGAWNRVRLLCSVYDRESESYRTDYSLIIGLLVGFAILGSVVYILVSEWRQQRRRVRQISIK
ncbi:MAG TPA: SCO family protein [Burkholderiaceae bacterium]|nr:SCO family protein [Burkholderiaceae bacterium]